MSMKTKTRILKTLSIALLAGLGLAGCVAVPVYDGPRAYGPAVYAPPVVVTPAIGFGYYGYRGHRYGGRHW
jgi:hypothetical protein